MKTDERKTKNVPASAFRCAVGPLELGEHNEGSKSAPFRMVARSGDAIDHWWWGRVVHDLAGMALKGNKVAIDYIHDENQIIGYANKFAIDTGNLEASGALTPFKDSDRATEIIHKAGEGVPYEASINFGGDGIKVEEIEDPEETVKVNGRTFHGPITIIREWPLRGIAVCPYGADANTSTNLSGSQQEIEVSIMATKKKKNQEPDETVLTETATPETDEQTESVESESANDTPEEAGDTPAVETGEEAAPAAETSEEAADIDPRTGKPMQHSEAKTGQDFLERFGDDGGVWFAQGKTWEEAILLHELQQDAKIVELEKRLANRSEGESSPVDFSKAEKSEVGKTGLAGKIRIAGKKYV